MEALFDFQTFRQQTKLVLQAFFLVSCFVSCSFPCLSQDFIFL
jgi:hypothetical protein